MKPRERRQYELCACGGIRRGDLCSRCDEPHPDAAKALAKDLAKLRAKNDSFLYDQQPLALHDGSGNSSGVVPRPSEGWSGLALDACERPRPDRASPT